VKKRHVSKGFGRKTDDEKSKKKLLHRFSKREGAKEDLSEKVAP